MYGLISNIKNEAGSSSSEPYFEAIAYYLESTRQFATKYTRSPLPCLLLMIFGPYIVFAGATWNLRPAVQVLSTPIFHATDTGNRLTVARHMAAFRKAIERLEDYYRRLSPTSLPVTDPPAAHIFPYPTTYNPLEGGEARTFKYEREVMEEKFIFFGTEEDGRKICIKFARTYSANAHRCLASLGCASVLRGVNEIAGGWQLVVFDALIEFETLDSRKEFPLSVLDDMSEKLTKFHDEGFVHGDIRDVNIMVKKEGTEFMFVDFDWSGKIGEARYPPLVNTSTIRRPPDALDGKLITTEHDKFMLDCIRQSKCRNT